MLSYFFSLRLKTKKGRKYSRSCSMVQPHILALDVYTDLSQDSDLIYIVGANVTLHSEKSNYQYIAQSAIWLL